MTQAQEVSIWGLISGVEDENGWTEVKNHALKTSDCCNIVVTGVYNFAGAGYFLVKKNGANLANRKSIIITHVSGNAHLYWSETNTTGINGIPLARGAQYEFNFSELVNLYVYSDGVASIRFAEMS